MKKKPKKIFVDPKNKSDRKTALDALKDKNFYLNDEDNEKVKGGFVERSHHVIKDKNEHDDMG